MNTLLKNLLIVTIGCSVAQVSAMKPQQPPLPLEGSEDVIYNIYLSNGKTMLDEMNYRQLLSVIKPSLRDALEREKSHKEIPGISKDGLLGVLANIDAILKKDLQALRGIYREYMTDQRAEDFCEFVFAAYYLGIEVVIASVQEFLSQDYKTIIEQEDSTFMVKLLTFQKNPFPQLGRLCCQKDGSTLIGYAASQGKSTIVSTLLSCGVDPNLADAEGIYSTYWSC